MISPAIPVASNRPVSSRTSPYAA